MKLYSSIFRSSSFNFLTLILSSFLSACGGGGGDIGGSNDTFTLSTNTISFIAETPSAVLTPQAITGTVQGDLSGTLYILINVNGSAIASVSNVVINNNSQSGTAYLTPTRAQTLGEGTHTASVTVRACLNDISCASGELPGSPKTVNVTYQVKSSVHEETVMPRVAKAGQSGDVIIRGYNFINDGINQVSFGNNDATGFTTPESDTEIHATYPALTAGTYPVTLSNNTGTTSFSGELVVIDPPAFSAGTLQYPSAPHQTLNTIYDADREVLFVAVSYFDSFNFNTDSRLTNQILKYQFTNGGFDSMDSVVIPLLQGLALSPAGDQLLAITDTQVLQLNPDTLTQTSSTTVDATFSTSMYLKDIIVTNDGNALITTGYQGSGSTPTYLYPISQPGLYQTSHSCSYYASPGVSANGAYAMFIQGGLSPEPPLCDYTSSTGMFSESSVTKNQQQCTNSYMGRCLRPVVNATGNRIAITDNGLTIHIYNQNHNLLGTLPINSEAVVFNSDSTRIYAYDTGSIVREYDLTANTVNGIFQEVGSGTSLTGSPGTGVLKMILSDDGNTLFIAGSEQIVIQPIP